MGHDTSQPFVGDIKMLKSLVIPKLASAITCAQFTAARSAGVRATPARKRALYECTNWMNCACVILVTSGSLIQVAGSGNPSELLALPAIAMAESRSARAALMTESYGANGTTASFALFSVMTAAES